MHCTYNYIHLNINTINLFNFAFELNFSDKKKFNCKSERTKLNYKRNILSYSSINNHGSAHLESSAWKTIQISPHSVPCFYHHLNSLARKSQFLLCITTHRLHVDFWGEKFLYKRNSSLHYIFINCNKRWWRSGDLTRDKKRHEADIENM